MTFSSLSGASPSEISDELLSAYIDGQLAAAERQRLERALAADAQARARLQALRMTITLLGQAPPAAVPRAFVLSEAMVLDAGGKLRHTAQLLRDVAQPGLFARLFGWLTRAMPLATAAVAVTLMLVVGADVWPQAAAPMTVPPQAASEMAVVEEPGAMDVQAERAAAKVVEATILVEKDEALAMGAAAADMSAYPLPADAPAEGLRAVGGGGEPMALESSSTLSPETVAAEAEAVVAAAPQAVEQAAPEPAATPSPKITSPTLRTVEYLLSGLLVIMLAVTWLLRRRSAG